MAIGFLAVYVVKCASADTEVTPCVALVVDGDALWIDDILYRLPSFDAVGLDHACLDAIGDAWPCE